MYVFMHVFIDLIIFPHKSENQKALMKLLENNPNRLIQCGMAFDFLNKLRIFLN